MVTFKRLMLWFSLFTGVLAFLVLAGNLSPKEQMIFGASILLLIIFLMGTGGGRKVERIRHRSEVEEEESESDPEQELPAPVQSEEDASARRDAKLSRSRSGEPEPEPDEPEVEEVVVSLADDEVSVTVIEANVHVAEEVVADIAAESREEAEHRMIERAEEIGANAITDIRFTTSMVMANTSEILAYGTAVMAVRS